MSHLFLAGVQDQSRGVYSLFSMIQSYRRKRAVAGVSKVRTAVLRPGKAAKARYGASSSNADRYKLSATHRYLDIDLSHGLIRYYRLHTRPLAFL